MYHTYFRVSRISHVWITLYWRPEIDKNVIQGAELFRESATSTTTPGAIVNSRGKTPQYLPAPMCIREERVAWLEPMCYSESFHSSSPFSSLLLPTIDFELYHSIQASIRLWKPTNGLQVHGELEK